MVDYWAKVNLAGTVAVTKTTKDAIASVETALAEVEVLLGVSWVADLTDPDTGEIGKLELVTDIHTELVPAIPAAARPAA